MVRSKGDLMRAHGKKSPGRKSFPNLGGANLTRGELVVEIHLEFIRIRRFLNNYREQVENWLKDIERRMIIDDDAI